MKPTEIAFVFFLIVASSVSGLSQSKAVPASTPQRISTNRRSPVFVDGRTIVTAIEFTGLDPNLEEYGVYLENGLYKSDFLGTFPERKLSINEGDKFNSQLVGQVLKRLKEWLSHKGYLKAEVVAYGTKLSQDQMRLSFAIDRGLQLDPPELNFVGAETLSDQEFVDDFKKCAGESWERYDPRVYEYFSHRCSERLLWSKGFLKGKINDINRKISGNHYLITFSVHEGDRYRWGDFKITGAKVFTNDELMKMFGQNTGDLADARSLQDFAFERLTSAYAERGYLHCFADPDAEIIDPKAEGTDGVVNVSLTIDEGPQFKVNRVEFVGKGVEEVYAESLVRDFPLKKGDIFVQSKFDEGIAAVNKSGEYVPLFKNSSNIEIRPDEESGQVYLTIRLTKISKLN